MLFFALLPVGAEITYRLISIAKTCRVKCDFSLLTRTYAPPYTKILQPKKPEFTKYDPAIGFDLLPNSEVKDIANEGKLPPWSFNINTQKLRKTSTNNSPKKILTIGDSFTFGEQVNNEQTWQSCLNTSQDQYEFLNGGVGGYGSLQAVTRSKQLLNHIEADALLLSIVSYADIIRDRMDFMMGFPSPALIKTPEGALKIANAPDPNTFGSKFSNQTHTINPFLWFVSNYSALFNRHYPEYSTSLANLLTRYHPSNASNKEVIRKIISELHQISKERKIPVFIMIQYADNQHDFYLNARTELLKELNSSGIPFHDTWDFLQKSLSKGTQRSEIWRTHHTPLGNQIICKSLLDSNLLSTKSILN